LPPARPTHRLLLKATALFLQLREWESLPRFARFAREAQNDLDLQRRRFDLMSFQVSRTLASIERLGEVKLQFSEAAPDVSSAEVDASIRRIVSDLIADSCDDIGSFYDDACLLAVRGAMMTEPRRKRRRALVADLGFVQAGAPAPVGYGILIATGLLLYVGMWLFFLILPTPNTNIEIKSLIALISIIVFGSIVIPTFAKLRWGFANSGLHGRTPYPFVIAAGLGAVLFAVVMQLGAGALWFGVIQGALRRLHDSSPWLPSVFGTAATIAWLIQDTRWLSHASLPRERRLKDALTLGGVWVLSTIVGSLLDVPINHHVLSLVALLKSVCGSFVFGGLIGYLIPEGIRVSDPVAIERMPLIGSSATTIIGTRPIDA
jgi:hypothetical protein